MGMGEMPEDFESFRFLASGRPSDRAAWLAGYGEEEFSDFRCTGAAGKLAAGVTFLRRAVLATEPGSPELPHRLAQLSAALSASYERSQDIGLLAEIVQVRREEVAVADPADAERPKRQWRLAAALAVHGQRTGRQAPLDEAALTYWALLAVLPPRDSLRGDILRDLTDLLEYLSDLGDTDRSRELVQACRELAATTPAGHPDHAENLARLARSLWSQHTVSADAAALAEAITLCQRLIEASPAHDPRRGALYAQLGFALWDRDQANWTIAAACAPGQGHLQALRQAVALTGPEYPDRAALLLTLAKALAVLHSYAPDAEIAAEFAQLAYAARGVVEDDQGWDTLATAARVFGMTLEKA
jgi:hypothetical protein